MSCIHTTEGVPVPQQEEAGNDAEGVGSAAPDPSTAIPGVIVVGPLSSSVSIFARNMVGLPTCTSYTDKTEQPKNVPAKEDSEERKKKTMDRLRKVSAYNCLLSFVVQNPQVAQVVVVCQATALLTVYKCPQFTQTLTLPTSQMTVQTVYDPPQSDVMVVAAQMWEAPQARALQIAQVCTFEAAPKSAPAAIQVECTFETDLVLAPQAPQKCALEVDQGTPVQTGQVSLVAGCKAGDG